MAYRGVGALDPARYEMAKDASNAKEALSDSSGRDRRGAATGRADARGAEIMGLALGGVKNRQVCL
jgi:hypothetical protein